MSQQKEQLMHSAPLKLQKVRSLAPKCLNSSILALKKRKTDQKLDKENLWLYVTFIFASILEHYFFLRTIFAIFLNTPSQNTVEIRSRRSFACAGRLIGRAWTWYYIMGLGIDFQTKTGLRTSEIIIRKIFEGRNRHIMKNKKMEAVGGMAVGYLVIKRIFIWWK